MRLRRPLRALSIAAASLAVASGSVACFEHDVPPPPDEGLASQLTLTRLDAGSSSHGEVTNVDVPRPKPLSSAASGQDSGIPAQIGARHILIQWIGAQSAGPQVVRTRAQALATAKEVLKRVQAGEDFARMAVEFSDEPNAGSRGGSLGRFGHGQMVPEFEAAAFRLQVGQISGIVETPFGFHIIQRTE
jgi:hypothetical protein